MTSWTTPSFRRKFESLSPAVQQLARKQYRLWRQDPSHPSLHFKKTSEYWSIRVSTSLRALGRIQGDAMYWFWIGPHDEYVRLIRAT